MSLIKIANAHGHILVNAAFVVDIAFQNDGEIILHMADNYSQRIDQETADTIVKALGGELKPQNDLTTAYLVRAERGETQNTNSPMWRCVTNTGERVNIFKHEDPKKNTFALFEKAGWADDLNAIDLFATVDFELSIPVVMTKNGKWNEIVLVHDRSDDLTVHVESF